MERKDMMMGGVKIEDAIGSSSCSSSFFPSMFDFSEEKGSLGFMELLGMQQYSYSYSPLLEFPDDHVGSATLKDPPETEKEECSDVQQQPATPNSSSISSLSSDTPVVNDEHNKTVDQPNQPPKQLKAKKTNEKKRQREARFAFMTKSEVDHLEDGYRWRKYGQKAVKNSPFPRSYYRCTSASCNVKKRVERSLTDPTIVVTTYEGRHTHPSPVMARSGTSITTRVPNYFASPMPRNYMFQNYQHHHQQTLVNNTLSSFGFSSLPSKNNIATFPHPRTSSSVLMRDHGLLQDVVPSHMMKEDN